MIGSVAVLFFHAWSWLHGPMRPYQHDFSPKLTRMYLSRALHICKAVCWRLCFIWHWAAKERKKENKTFDACTQCVLAIFPILMNPSCFRRFQINIIKCIICINCPYRYMPYWMSWMGAHAMNGCKKENLIDKWSRSSILKRWMLYKKYSNIKIRLYT